VSDNVPCTSPAVRPRPCGSCARNLIPVIAIPLMPYEDGYYFTVENAPRARARYDEWNAWTTQHSLAWDGVGLDIEPEARAMMCLRLAPRDDTARRRPARGKPSSNAERGAVGQRSPLARARQCGRRRMDCAPLAHGETMTMQLPFTREQFFDVFAAYNAALWPGVLALWIASALVAVLLFARPHRASDRIVSTLLAIHWAWSALAYHMAFFTSINPAAIPRDALSVRFTPDVCRRIRRRRATAPRGR
jgi:hypothetical protein